MKTILSLTEKVSCAFVQGERLLPEMLAKGGATFEGVNLEIVGHFLIDSQCHRKEGHLSRFFKSFCKGFDHTFLNEKKEFSDEVVTYEKILLHLESALIEACLKVDEGFSLHSFSLIKGNSEYWHKKKGSSFWSYTQRVIIQCVHRHHNKELNPEENLELYGPCSRKHGHEYQVFPHLFFEKSVVHQKDFMGLEERVKKWLLEKVYHRYHGTYLNEKIGNTSGEILLSHLTNELAGSWVEYGIEADRFEVSLRETKKNSFHTAPNLFPSSFY